MSEHYTLNCEFCRKVLGKVEHLVKILPSDSMKILLQAPLGSLLFLKQVISALLVTTEVIVC